MLADEKGEGRAALDMAPYGSPGLTLSDEKGTTRAALWLLADGSPKLLLCDEKGKLIWSAP